MIYSRAFFFLFLLFSFPAVLLAQTLKVVDETNQQPIGNVYIYNSDQNKMISTDADGEAELQKFSTDDTLNFQHPAYETIALSFEEVESQSFRVVLPEKSITMDEVFVSASKREQNQEEIPQKISQITQEQMLFDNPQTSADLLKESGKVFIQKSQMGGGSPMIRGFAANAVLIAVDGIRMNNAIFRGGNLQNVISIDTYALQNTEVLFGPGSTIYGSDALGGVMNFQTKEPELSFSEDGKVAGAFATTRFSSANNERTIHADASIGFEKWGALTSVTYSKFDDMRSGGNFYDEYPDFGKRREYIVREDGDDRIVENDDVTLQRFSGYEQMNLMQKFRYKPSSSWEASYGFHYATTGDIPRYDRLIQREDGTEGQLVNAEWYYGPQIWMMNNLSIENTGSTALYDKVSGIFSHQWFQESRNDRDFEQAWLRNREENVDVYNATVDFDKHWSDDKELYYGLQTVYNVVHSDAHQQNLENGTRELVPTRYPDEGSNYTQLAAYAQYNQDVTSNLTAVGGIRYSHILLDAHFGDQFYDFPFSSIDLNTGAFSGSLGFTYRPTATLQFSLNGSSGFRAPNVDDAAKVFDSEPGSVVVPNADLEPEYTYNLDVSVIKSIGDMARIEINTFYTWLEDAMVRDNFQFSGQDSIVYDGVMSEVEAITNAGKAYIFGASAGFSAELNTQWTFSSDITYTDGKDRANEEPLRHVAPLFGKASLTYKRAKTNLETYAEFNGKKKLSDMAPSERKKTHLYTSDGSPAWTTLNFKGSYQFTNQARVTGGIENVLDKHYRPYSSGISAAGRNIFIGLQAQL